MTDAQTRPLAVVTGASSGVGYELARQFAEHGYDLVIVAEDAGITQAARDMQALGTTVESVRADLATWDGVERLWNTATTGGRHPDAVAINAGVGVGGEFTETDLRHEVKDSGVTVTALMPGPTDTEFFERAGLADTRVGQGTKDDPAEVAKDGFEALMAGKDKVVAGSVRNKAQAASARVMPDPAKAAMHGKLSEPG